MKKTFIIDTNILLNNPASIFKFDDNDVVIPISVIEEVDTFKKDLSETGRNAREVSRILDRLRERGTLSAGIPLFEGRDDSGRLFVNLGADYELVGQLAKNTDNQILAVALTLQKQHGTSRKVVIITKDSNLRIKADAFNISAEDFEADKVDISHLYKGIATMRVSAEVINDFYSRREIRLEDKGLFPNQFVILEDEADANQFVYGMYDGQDRILRMLDPHSEGVWGIYPRNIEQTFALEALLDDNIKLVTLSGGAGTGKTLMAIAAGLSKTTDDDEYHKLLVARPIFPLGKDIGFLPGDLDEKLNPWMQPIFDNLELLLSGGQQGRTKRFSKSYQELINQGMLAVEPLTYIRGRSLPNQFFVVDEAQNLTPKQMKTLITRAGPGTKVICMGNIAQIDTPYLTEGSSGLTYVVDRFKGWGHAGHITLQRGERSRLADFASEAL
ncbi:MAG: PhoH family protein [Betaproteobacteria bacterium]|nr:PhoH family protein [Betaproteobacteria bacterium]